MGPLRCSASGLGANDSRAYVGRDVILVIRVTRRLFSSWMAFCSSKPCDLSRAKEGCTLGSGV